MSDNDALLSTLVALVVRKVALVAVARPAGGTLVWAVAKMHPLVPYPRAGLGIRFRAPPALERLGFGVAGHVRPQPRCRHKVHLAAGAAVERSSVVVARGRKTPLALAGRLPDSWVHQVHVHQHAFTRHRGSADTTYKRNCRQVGHLVRSGPRHRAANMACGPCTPERPATRNMTIPY